MASPLGTISGDVAGPVVPLANKLSSEPLLLAAIVVIVTASLAALASWIVYKLLTKRDDAFRTLALEINTLSTCITKVVEVQALDHASTIKNRDLLQDITVLATKLEGLMKTSYQDVRRLTEDLQKHAKDCADRLQKQLQTNNEWKGPP